MKDWRILLLAGLVLVTVGVLTALHDVPPEVVVGLVSAYAGWLVPSPLPLAPKQP